MPINDCPFLSLGGVRRPYLPINIINPHTGKNCRTIGLIDTGADECAIPAQVAVLLGHDLQAVKPKTILTGNSDTEVYPHTTKFEIYHPLPPSKLLYTISDTPIDYMPNLHIVLLGVKSFLSKFVLNINYPEQSFSIKHP